MLLLLAAMLFTQGVAWPGMKPRRRSTSTPVIGPPCTVGAHAASTGKCPNMPQPEPPSNSTAGKIHTWPNAFVVDWTMTFDQNMENTPPWGTSNPGGSGVNITHGRTFYEVTNRGRSSLVVSMRETYRDFCIPVFGPLSSNNFGCSFINRMAGQSNGTSYVLFDSPDLPECCVIGRPFHPPSPDFAHAMPMHYRDTAAGGQEIDWNVVYDNQAGPFAYGFDSKSSAPAQFYMTGVLAQQPLWMVQRFTNFQPSVVPPASTWDLPMACALAEACPGWEPVDE